MVWDDGEGESLGRVEVLGDGEGHVYVVAPGRGMACVWLGELIDDDVARSSSSCRVTRC
jgi:hypothetical protein